MTIKAIDFNPDLGKSYGWYLRGAAEAGAAHGPRRRRDQVAVSIGHVMILCVSCKSSRSAKNPLWLLAVHLHRSLAQAQRPALASGFA